MEDWSAPDARGVRAQALDVGARATLRGRRKRRNFTQDIHAAAAWPMDWRELARDWFGGGDMLRWSTLLKRAGPSRVVTATELLDALLFAGWIEMDEKRESGGRWVPAQILLLDLERSREALGLPNRERLAANWAEIRARRLDEPTLADAATQLDHLAPALALRRYRWLTELDRWCLERRSGTRRDFAYFASGHTKGISEADWNWLASALDLTALGIDPHTPLLLIHGPLCLVLQSGRLDLSAAPDFLGITPASLSACVAVQGQVERYRLIENRTSFEHACRAAAPSEAVIWLPGHPPGWWRESMARLLQLHPAPAVIEADPDPAGIAIACEAGEVWTQRDLAWATHNMDAAVLDRLPRVQALSDVDRVQLENVMRSELPPGLRALGRAMLTLGIKGEQEGLVPPVEAERSIQGYRSNAPLDGGVL